MTDPVAKTQQFFDEAVPAPNAKNVAVQMGVHFEEIGEMLDNIEIMTDRGAQLLYHTNNAIKSLAKFLKTEAEGPEVKVKDDKELLDALCDQIVTSVGVGHMRGYNVEGALDHVGDSNLSKFVDGKAIFNENGKIAKGPDFFQPNLEPFLTKTK